MTASYSGSITQTFYSGSGYVQTDNGTGAYIPVDRVNYVYIPSAEQWVNRMGATTLSITVSAASNSTADSPLIDRLVAEYSMFLADSEYDTVRRDPETGQPENRHYDTAFTMLLDLYGIWDEKYGKVFPPGYKTSNEPYNTLTIADGTV